MKNHIESGESKDEKQNTKKDGIGQDYGGNYEYKDKILSSIETELKEMQETTEKKNSNENIPPQKDSNEHVPDPMVPVEIASVESETSLSDHGLVNSSKGRFNNINVQSESDFAEGSVGSSHPHE